MEPNLYLKYRSANYKDNSEVDLALLGESIVGFDRVIKDIFKLSRIKGEIELRATKIRKGCLIVDIAVGIVNILDNVPFDSIPDFLDFAKVVNVEIWSKANEFFSEIGGGHRKLNDFAKKYPADFGIVMSGITLYLSHLIGKAPNNKEIPQYGELPKRYANGLHRIIKNGGFKKGMKPFVENELESMEVSHDPNFKIRSIIDTDNFDKYLGEKEKVLPDYEDGGIYTFTGEIVAIQCTKGDSLKIRIDGFPRKHRDVVAFPEKEKTTKDYHDFYQQKMVIEAEIKRKSLYQKPQINIRKIEPQRKSFNGIEAK